MSECLSIGTKVYYSGWDENWNPRAFEHTITGYQERGGILIYLFSGGGFSKKAIGKNVFLSEFDALENLKGIVPQSATTSLHFKRKRG